MKIEFEIITLEWKKENWNNFPNQSGVYQIYGTSPLYGYETLLYIGQAGDLKIRIKDHLGDKENVIGRQANLSCRYALTDKLDIVEQTLIVMYKPSFNSIGLKNISHSVKERGYYIQNHGERGLLNYENTNFYFLNNLDNLLGLESE